MSKDDNQITPVSDNVEEAVKSETQVSVSDVTKETAPAKEIPAQKTEAVSSVFDAQKNYDVLRSEFEKVSKNYSELRKEFTRRTQNESELQKKMDSLLETISKATETPINPEQFIRDLQTQGPKALEPHFKKWVEPIKIEYDKALEEKDNHIFALQRDFTLARMRTDSSNYPDFTKLETVMKEIAEDDNCPVDFDKPVNEIYHALYKLAKDRSAEQAVKLAHEEGKKDAELQLAKEAKTTVAGGGKTGGTTVPNWDKMSADKMRDVVAQLHGIADRD